MAVPRSQYVVTMEQRLSIITLAVSDLAVSRAFYRDVFGWNEIEPRADDIAFFQLPGLQFALYPAAAMAAEHNGLVAAPQGFTLAYNVNSRDDVDEVYAHVTGRGATSLKEPEEVFWGGYSCYVAGPDGEQWEIAYNPFTAVNEDGTYGAWR
ncbi:MAG: VOC family protein [Acidimicrobiia bacterium]|nr:VOC family protein [Acidimicrobiia bacterium]